MRCKQLQRPYDLRSDQHGLQYRAFVPFSVTNTRLSWHSSQNGRFSGRNSSSLFLRLVSMSADIVLS